MINYNKDIARRKFLGSSPVVLGSMGLSSLLGENKTLPNLEGNKPKAKRVIYLFMSGGPSHLDTFDPKPLLIKRDGEKIPEEIVKNHEFAMIKESGPKLKGSDWKFHKKGKSGIEVSELFPEVGNVIDNICLLYTSDAADE